MQYEWILDVLSDLKAFAQANGLPILAEQLDDTTLVAAAEIAQLMGTTGEGRAPHANEAGRLHRSASAGDGG